MFLIDLFHSPPPLMGVSLGKEDFVVKLPLRKEFLLSK